MVYSEVYVFIRNYFASDDGCVEIKLAEKHASTNDAITIFMLQWETKSLKIRFPAACMKCNFTVSVCAWGVRYVNSRRFGYFSVKLVSCVR